MFNELESLGKAKERKKRWILMKERLNSFTTQNNTENATQFFYCLSIGKRASF